MRRRLSRLVLAALLPLTLGLGPTLPVASADEPEPESTAQGLPPWPPACGHFTYNGTNYTGGVLWYCEKPCWGIAPLDSDGTIIYTYAYYLCLRI